MQFLGFLQVMVIWSAWSLLECVDFNKIQYLQKQSGGISDREKLKATTAWENISRIGWCQKWTEECIVFQN